MTVRITAWILAVLTAMLPFPAASETPTPRPPVRGLYCSGWAAGSRQKFNSLVGVIERANLNAMVIDIKGNDGRLSYKSRVPFSVTNGTGQAKIPDIAAVIKTLDEHRIFPIARIVTFRDPHVAARMPEFAVRNRAGGVWKDNQGTAWVDPYNRKYWDYLVDVAIEAIGHGFREIQFDYVRFTSDGPISDCVYSFRDGLSHEDLIAAFLKYAKQKLAPYGVPVSADIFGLSTSLADDVGVGQKFEKITAQVDVVCPMVYPSHYRPGNFGLDDPDLHPYTTVYNGVSDGVRRLKQAGASTVMRPWLQAFSLGNPYGRDQIQAQVKAVRDAGATEWLFWNASCTYRADELRAAVP